MFREKDVLLACQSLTDGSSLLVKGWRRIGKSSLLTETARLLNEENKNVIAIVVDVQDLVSMSEFLSKVIGALPKDKSQQLYAAMGAAKQIPGKVMNAIQNRIRSIGGSGGGVEANVEFNKNVTDYWEPLKTSFEALAKQSQAKGERIILMIDELPFFLENLYRQSKNVDNIRTVLATLRSWRTAGLSMAIAGSVSIEAFLEDLKIEGLVLNDLIRLDLRPLKRAEAETFTETLAKVGNIEDWNDEATKTLLDQLPDHFPFFIQSAMNFLRVEDNSTTDTINEVFENQIYPQIFASFFQQFDERLDRRFSKEKRKAAVDVLNEMSATHEGCLTVNEIEAICEARSQDPLQIMRRLELAEFIRSDLKKKGYKLAQNLLKTWRTARGGV
ncbi:MAG: hypothetical protein GY748_24300 [Planctomycetaceae bacterium]|nr:hypothetical protein [Planctomycetaceae bacterium]